jgi:hypothetical protein
VLAGAPAVPAISVGGIAVSIDPATIVASAPFTLSGTGAGQGLATFHAAIPDLPSLVGVQVSAQWFVVDPAAAGRRRREYGGHVDLVLTASD